MKVDKGKLEMYYLDVAFELPENRDREISGVFLKNFLIKSVKSVFGLRGADCTMDILKYNVKNKRFILRCFAKDYVRVRSALTLANNYEENVCIFTVRRASPSPFGLLSDGRNYKFNT